MILFIQERTRKILWNAKVLSRRWVLNNQGYYHVSERRDSPIHIQRRREEDNNWHGKEREILEIFHVFREW